MLEVASNELSSNFTENDEFNNLYWSEGPVVDPLLIDVIKELLLLCDLRNIPGIASESELPVFLLIP